MKTILLCLALWFALPAAYAQNNDADMVPQPVLDAFNKVHPGNEVYDWDKIRRDDIYEAEYKKDGTRYEAFFTADGTWLRTERELDENDLPPTVKSGFGKSRFAGWKIDDVVELATPEHEVLYELEIENGDAEFLVYLTPEGKVVKEVQTED